MFTYSDRKWILDSTIGYTNDLRARLRQHKAGKCCATAHRNPWKLIYYEAYLNQAG